MIQEIQLNILKYNKKFLIIQIISEKKCWLEELALCRGFWPNVNSFMSFENKSHGHLG